MAAKPKSGLLVAGLSAAAIVLVAGLTIAASPEEQVGTRQGEMKKMGKAMKAIFSFVKNEGGTVADVAAGAKVVNAVSKELVPSLFPSGTGVGIDDSEAKPEIWQDWPGFKKEADALIAASGKLIDVAVDGAQPDAIRAAAVGVGKVCGSCHETYRLKK